jgi:hypothetical protein
MLPMGFDPYPIPPEVDEDMKNLIINRLYMTDVYGGSFVESFPKIRKALVDKHGLDDFMYPNLVMNPFAPQIPGSHGLFFGLIARGFIEEPDDDQIYRVISRLESGKWQYQGQYIMGYAPRLTTQEWASQPRKVGPG